MLTHMMVQYIVGLCCLRGNPDSIDVELGALVLDDAVNKKRDVDITVTLSDRNGEVWAFKAFEVKDENSPLDVTVVEQLCSKLNDMSSVTYRAIVSSSGFSAAAKRKAQRHHVELYVLEKWTNPIEWDFPRFGLERVPEEAIPVNRRLLVWVDAFVHVVAPTAGGSFNIDINDQLFDSKGSVHAKYQTFGQYRNEILLRSTGLLLPLEPAQTMMRSLPEIHASGRTVTPEWPYGHTLEVSPDDVYVKVKGLNKIEQITISGYMRYQGEREKPEFRIMRRVRDDKPFAGALIARLGEREGHFWAWIMSDSPVSEIHLVQLEEKHLNMIRQLKVDRPS